MSAKYKASFYNADGHLVGGGDGFLPQYLDWMPIEVKAFWFSTMGQGHPDTKYALLSSQGEQLLITEITLETLTHQQYKDKQDGIHEQVDRFIEDGGYSRTPRNQ